jgi:endonuclease/exonuclease/phosphatase family metal-dependent hydrolase
MPEGGNVRRRSFLGLTAALVGAGGVVGLSRGWWPYSRMHPETLLPPSDPNILRAAVWNIRRGTVAGFPGPLSDLSDLRTTANVIRSIGAHVISIPEVDNRAIRTGFVRQLHHLERQLNASSCYAPTVSAEAGRRELWPGDRGDGLLSRLVPTVPYKIIELSHDPTLPRAEPRSLIVGWVQFGGYVVCVCSAHLGVASAAETKAQLRQCLSWIRNNAGTPYVVFPGDFNLDPDSVDEIVAEFGDIGLFRVPNNDPTFVNGTIPDHILCAGFDVTSFRVVRTPIGDHYALVADLRPQILEHELRRSSVDGDQVP